MGTEYCGTGIKAGIMNKMLMNMYTDNCDVTEI